MRVASVEPRQLDVSVTTGTLTDRTSVIVAGFTGALTGSLGVMHGGYFSTAWGWGSLACLWVVLLALLVSDRLDLGRI